LHLWKVLADESASWCCTSATQDFKTVQCRFEHEGSSFLTITLPAFGKDFERSLELGQVDRSLFAGFQWKGCLPRFLGGFTGQVFDRASGRLLDEPSVDAILAVRQLTLLVSKLFLTSSDTRVEEAMRQFVKCEQDVREADERRTTIDLDRFLRMSSLLLGDLLTVVDRKVYYGEVVPKHGPGATADRLVGNGKYTQRVWPARLEKVFSSSDFLIPNYRYYDDLEQVNILEPEAEIPVKVIAVPKTQKTPRIIAIEPTAMQYAQQAVWEAILDAFEEGDPLSRKSATPRIRRLWKMISFTDQEPNRALALEGSLTGELATLDLSEASDRVSNVLVRTMLSPWPQLQQAVDACRSRSARVPGHGVIPLAKFASMGSALCFPMEAFVFLTLIFLGIEQELNRPLEREDIVLLSRRVRVFGDDIIVPVEYVHSVIRTLEHFGAKVNVRKSFWNGKFRESCGQDCYAGQDINIVKVRQHFPSSPRDATGVISLVELRNQFYKAGYWQTARWLDSRIRKVIKHFPTVLEDSPVLGRVSFLGYESQRECDKLHIPLVKGYVVKARLPQNSVDGAPALLKYFLKRGVEPSFNKEHLERSGRPEVRIKLGWSSAI
jgi:hypothetical protein